MIKKSIDGTFWHGKSFTTMSTSFQFFHFAAHHNHSLGRYLTGFLQCYGQNIHHNQQKGQKNILKAFTSGDSFLIKYYAEHLLSGIFNWSIDKEKAKETYKHS